MIPLPRVIDLTHPLSPASPRWPGDPPTEITRWAEAAREGYVLNCITVGEHSGTHLGAPAHVQPEGRTVDQLPAAHLVRQAVVIDYRAASVTEPDATLGIGDIVTWEAAHGAVPWASVALLCSGWSSRWHDPDAYFNRDAAGAMHYPGFSSEAVRFLVEERGVVGLGIDAPGIDAGMDVDLSANRMLLREHRFHLENLTNLEQLPPVDVLLIIGALPIVGGTGAPARVIALLPH